MKYFLSVLALVGLLTLSGFYINYQNNRIVELEDSISVVIKRHADDVAHYDREIKRQDALSDLKEFMNDSNNMAKNDPLGADGLFSSTRLRRIEEIR